MRPWASARGAGRTWCVGLCLGHRPEPSWAWQGRPWPGACLVDGAWPRRVDAVRTFPPASQSDEHSGHRQRRGDRKCRARPRAGASGPHAHTPQGHGARAEWLEPGPRPPGVLGAWDTESLPAHVSSAPHRFRGERWMAAPMSSVLAAGAVAQGRGETGSRGTMHTRPQRQAGRAKTYGL